MKDHLRFTVCYWHTFRGTGSDPFGPAERCSDLGTMVPNRSKTLATEPASRLSSLKSLQAPYYAFHDRDVAPEGSTLTESNANFDCRRQGSRRRATTQRCEVAVGHRQHVQQPAVHARCGDHCNVEVFAYAAAQVKKALEVTHQLGGENYVFWGGREGYQNLYNTDMKRELDHLASFFHMAVDYAKEIGFTGQFLIEPKPKEPTKHQYDSDAAACLNFLRAYDLMDHFKLNIETNHATLAGHTMMHELEYAGMQGCSGSIDANTGDLLLGWDTDQFPTDYYLTTQTMLVLLKYGDWHRAE